MTTNGAACRGETVKYSIKDIGEQLEGELAERLGGGRYKIRIDGALRDLKVLSVGPRGIEFVLDKKYHSARYIDKTTAGMSLIVDGTPVQVGMHAHLDAIVYKNSGSTRDRSSETALQSQIPGKVVSISVSEGDSVRKGDSVIVLESMKMQVAVKSHRDGTVAAIRVKQGDSVAKNDVIAEIK